MKTMRTKRATTIVTAPLIQDVHTGDAVWLHPVSGRVHHPEDISLQGPSLALSEWESGRSLPHPLSTPPPVTTHARSQSETIRRTMDPSRDALACPGCGRITGCTCGPSTAPGLAGIVAMQKSQGRR